MADNTIAAIIFYSFCALVCFIAIWLKSNQDDGVSTEKSKKPMRSHHRHSH